MCLTHTRDPASTYSPRPQHHPPGADEYVLDLRGNPGGSVQAAVEVASVFLDGEKVVTYIQVRSVGCA